MLHRNEKGTAACQTENREDVNDIHSEEKPIGWKEISFRSSK